MFELFGIEQFVTLKYGLQVTEGHRNWYHSKALVQFLIHLP